MQTNPAVERNKTLNGPRVRGISPVGEEKVYGGSDLPKSQVLSSEWKTERVREDASGDRENGEEDDDELPCVIGESEGDCVRRGSRRSVASMASMVHSVSGCTWGVQVKLWDVNMSMSMSMSILNLCYSAVVAEKW